MSSVSPLDRPPAPETPGIVSLLPSALPPVQCRNCGTGLTGPYCGECGQRDGPLDPSLRELFADAWDAFVSVDGKVLSSLRLLLLRPGALTAEYLGGRRARHLTPLRLYLICSVAYFLVTSLVPDKAKDERFVSLTLGSDTVRVTDNARRRGKSDAAGEARDRAVLDSMRLATLARHRIPLVAGVLDSSTRAQADSTLVEEGLSSSRGVPSWMRARLVHGMNSLRRDRKGFGQDYKSQLPRLMFILMPVSALLLGLAYRSRRRRYSVHLIVALHLHAFVFALFTLGAAQALVRWSPLAVVMKTATILWACAYLPLALRRVYGGRMRYAIVRTVVVVCEYSVVGAAAVAILAVALLLTY